METLPATQNRSAGPLTIASCSPEELEVIKKQFFPQNASIADMEYCFAVANNLNLNPLTKEIQFVGRRAKVKVKEGNGPEIEKWVEKVEPMLGRDGYLSIAHRTNSFAGIETTSAIKEAPKLDAKGEWSTVKTLVATCKVYKKGVERPFVVEVAYNEYVQTTSEGKPTKFWSSMPDTMLKKVAESQALRKAFNINGVSSAEELGIGIVDETGKLVLDAESQAVPTGDSLGKPDAPAVKTVEADTTPLQGGVIDADLTGAKDTTAEEISESPEPAQETEPDQNSGGRRSATPAEIIAETLITPTQCAELNRKITEYGADFHKFLEFMKVKSLADIPQNAYGTANAALEAKRAQNEAEAKKTSAAEGEQAGLFSGTEQTGSSANTMSSIMAELAAKRLSPQVNEETGVVVVKIDFKDTESKIFLKSIGFKYNVPGKFWEWSK